MDNDNILTEFSIPSSEINADLQVGDLGKLVLSVEVIGRLNDTFIFRKHKKALPEGNFRPENAKDMRERMLEKQDEEAED